VEKNTKRRQEKGKERREERRLESEPSKQLGETT